MGKYLGSTGLTYLWGKIKSIFVTKTELAGHPTGRIYYGTCSTTANTYTKVATVDTFPLDEDDKPLVGTVVAIKYTVTNTYKTEGQTYALNVNNTGAYPMYYNNAEVATSTSANTLAAGYKNRHVLYVFNGTQWVWLSASYDTNTTYSGMTQAEVDAGTGTTARLITPARLRDNFYTEDEVDNLIEAITPGDENVIETVKVNGTALTPDANKAVNIDLTVKADLNGSSSHFFTASNLDVFDGGESCDISAIYTDDKVTLQFTDSVEGNTLSYTFNPGENERTIATTDDIPAAVTESTVSGWGFTKNTGTYSKPSGGIPASDLASGVIPTVPTNVSAFTNDAGYTTNTGTITGITMNGASKGTSGVVDLGTVLTAHQDISGKEDKLSIDSTDKTASFTASVGNYYKVSVAASGSIMITLTTPSDNTKVSSCVFFVSTSTSPTLNFSAASGISIYKSKDFAIEESTYYELNALWNGTSWYIAQMELEVQS